MSIVSRELYGDVTISAVTPTCPQTTTTTTTSPTMPSEDPSPRNRKPPPTSIASGTPAGASATKSKDDDDDDVSSGISFVDVLRVLSLILLLSSVMSWFVTDGESLTWGYKPAALRWNNVRMMFVSFSYPRFASLELATYPIHHHHSGNP